MNRIAKISDDKITHFFRFSRHPTKMIFHSSTKTLFFKHLQEDKTFHPNSIFRQWDDMNGAKRFFLRFCAPEDAFFP